MRALLLCTLNSSRNTRALCRTTVAQLTATRVADPLLRHFEFDDVAMPRDQPFHLSLWVLRTNGGVTSFSLFKCGRTACCTGFKEHAISVSNDLLSTCKSRAQTDPVILEVSVVLTVLLVESRTLAATTASIFVGPCNRRRDMATCASVCRCARRMHGSLGYVRKSGESKGIDLS